MKRETAKQILERLRVKGYTADAQIPAPQIRNYDLPFLACEINEDNDCKVNYRTRENG